jgi:hypothetical protein
MTSESQIRAESLESIKPRCAKIALFALVLQIWALYKKVGDPAVSLACGEFRLPA